MVKSMYSKGADNRSDLVAAATKLFLTRGFETTSFQDLAEDSGVPKGNIYYYFKSKDELLEAVIAGRMQVLDVQLEQLDVSSPDPLQRLNNFLTALFADTGELVLYGCPHGSLCLELAKGKDSLLPKAAVVLRRLAEWFTQQMRAAHVPGDPAQLGQHMLLRIEGITLLGATFRDPEFVGRELAQLRAWIDDLRPATASMAAVSR
ncbi:MULTISPECIES: TetR/AcrR family transcriptional regulator [Rhodomicrobium]|uniref:TetR/AcrR family transcriptional regulator n=1 Tax=Rhodomicrobium TaxID=1068 RepID=UPI000B4B719B|nr:MULTISPECIES: TetR/AcrR family transcriptional regulator [Rhodomicrobium]